MVSRAEDERSSQTIQTINPFRGLVCCSIVLLHACFITMAPEQWLVFYEYRPGVESFFILSGFFLAHMLRPAEGTFSVGRLLLRRFLRLAVPFWAILLLIAVVRLVWFVASDSMNWYHGVLPSLAELLFINDLLGLPRGLMDASHWSLASLMQFYMIAYLGFWAVRRVFIRLGCEKDHACTLSAFLASAFFLLVGWEAAHVTRRFTFYGDFWMLPRWIGFAAAGYLAYQASVRYIPAAVGVVVSASLLAIGVATGGGFGDGSRWIWGGITTALLFVLGRYNPPVPAVPPFSWLGRLGQWSFSIYLVHGPVMY
jgi:peptidoglycan/LPS O-acetylase OafA/YrhL